MMRDISMDVLRILAALSVILLHVSAGYLEKTSVNSLQWSLANILDSSTRWCVPVFVMISGTFLLQKDISIKKLYFVKIRHLMVLLIGWSVFYNIASTDTRPRGYEEIISLFLTNGGGYHLWFLYMLIGVYVAIPLVRKIVDGGLAPYVLCLWLCTAVALAGIEPGLKTTRLFQWVEYVVAFPFAVKYVGYFILGHYLYTQVNLSVKIRRLIYLLGILGFAGIAVGTAWLSGRHGTLVDYFYNYHNIFVVFSACALFIRHRYNRFSWVAERPRMLSAVKLCSNLTLGVYLIHIVVMDKIYSVLLPFEWHIAVAIPAIWLSTAMVSFGLSFVLYKIPYLNAIVK